MVASTLGRSTATYIALVSKSNIGAEYARSKIMTRKRFFSGALAILIVGCPVIGQTPDADGRIQALEREVAAQKHLLRDWGHLTRYGSANTELNPPTPGQDRVVFLGDQITESWGRDGTPFFAGKPYLNRGISGQTTPQMLVRFRQDVISLKPKVVVIQGGANDLAGVSGPATEEMIAENLMSMTDLAKAHGIRVVLASLTPVCGCGTKLTRKRSQEIVQGKIVEINELLKDYAAQSGSVYLDYYSELADGQEFKKQLTSDGAIPNAAGYRVMAQLAERAIAEALAGK